jgi:quercetin dioxygenase-like cupin family protein
MMIFDLINFDAAGYENRNVNVFFENEIFKTRVISLDAGQKIPECMMETFVMFYAVLGEVTLCKNNETLLLKEGQAFITEPALLSMETTDGARLMGIQFKAK